MGLESLRKHIQELKERGILGSSYENPGADTYQPTNLSPVEPYNPPEVAVPISTNTQAPKTTPVSAVKPVVPTASTAKADPKSGQNGLKAFTDITSKSPQFGETGIGNTDLIDAYNAGLNGTDLSRETRDNAAAGGYLDSIETMFNAGLQDSSLSKNVDGFSPEKVDNTKNTSYTAGNTTGNTDAGTNSQDEYVPKMGADTSKQATSNATSGDGLKPYPISDSEKELNYMMDMFFMNGAASSSDPSVRMAYEWVSNPNNKGEKIPQEVLNAYYDFMGNIDKEQIARSNKIVVGNTPNPHYYPEAKNASPVNSNLAGLVESIEGSQKKNSEESYKWGDAARNALGELIKADPKILATKSGVLNEAYQAGLKGNDLSKILRENAETGDYLDDIWKMYQAGETDAKIAKGDTKLGSLNYSDKSTPGYFNYVENMMTLSGAVDSTDPNVKKAYEYFKDTNNRGKEVPQEMKDAFYSFLKGIKGDDDKDINSAGERRVRLYEIATGIELDGLKSKFVKPDGSYSTKEDGGEVIGIGPYAGCRVSQGFNDTYTNLKGHIGYDIVGNFSNIHPIFDGEIVAIQADQYFRDGNGNKIKLYDKDGNFSGYKKHDDGVTVTVKHKNAQGQEFYTTYCHLAEHSVDNLKKGSVTTDSIIGIKDGTGRSTGDHLHLAVYTREKDSSNPYGYTEDKQPFKDYTVAKWGKSYKLNNVYYDVIRKDNGYQGRYYDPYLVMLTNGEIISLYP